MHPLPRSLDPVSGESLVSYLLRLGHRLGLSPLHLIRAAGWTEHAYPNHFPGSLLLDLPRPQAEAFARLTKQTAGEVSALTLAQWRDRYPPITRSMPSRRLMRPDAWLFVGSPRYCPSCLAGDGTPAQQLHGGPWHKLWHLPVVFTCVEHQTYLEADCPHCGQPHDTPGHLIQRANDHTLHPAQCRWTIDTQTQKRKSRACGGRLDQPLAPLADDRPQPEADILRFQQTLLARLAPQNPATDASEYFTDLRLAAALVSTTWPQGWHLFDTDAADLIDSYSRKLHRDTGRARYQRLRDAPPRDAIACGALLVAADRLLSRDDLPELLSDFVLAAFKDRPSRTPWALVFDRHEDACSERLRQAAEPVTRSFRRVNGSRGIRAPLRTVYRPEYIPAFLEPDWYQRHLADCAGSASKIVRRTAAVRLVQWAMGGSQDDAATFLGITSAQAHFAARSDTRRWLRAGCEPVEFDRALRALAAELQTPRQPPTDYRRRRQALLDWTLSLDIWNTLISDLPRSPYSTRSDSGDRKRQAASVYVWTLVTRGEHHFAPRPLEATQLPEVRRQWALQRNTTWFQLARPDPIGHYADLRQALAKYAQQLARDIDSGAGPAGEGASQGHSETHAQ
ncbi:mucin [Streptomyces himastatinicus ATCC 53653]|uniref:Mucin n=1 Tax=Streptomyces himastatinicus ATCC 53653 TaxID=457427 RepID=D9WQY2_9ACTN|nr:TniQ family protein [Streptomyces himastatinicus]EFL21959.1 mucin [Streptomyces himastatinicus ATCC 53653]